MGLPGLSQIKAYHVVGMIARSEVLWIRINTLNALWTYIIPKELAQHASARSKGRQQRLPPRAFCILNSHGEFIVRH